MLSRRVRVLQYLAPDAVGGIETVVEALTTKLDHSVLDVGVAAMVRSGAPGERWVEALRVKGVRCAVLPPTYRLWRDLASLKRVISEQSPDVLHTHGYRADLLGAVLRQATRPKLVATVHGFTPVDAKLAFYGWLDRRALRRFDLVLPVAATIRDTLVRERLAPERLRLVPNAVEVPAPPAQPAALRAALGFPAGAILVGTVGRLSPEKGHQDLLAAFASLVQRHPTARLIIVGDGPTRARLETQAVHSGLAGRIHFLGRRRDIERLYPCFHVFALPSHTEGCPTALIEALAYGIPIVATAVGAVPEMVQHGVEGYLIPPREPGRLAAALVSMLDAEPAWPAFAAAGRRRYEAQFRLAPWLERMTATYLDLAQPRR